MPTSPLRRGSAALYEAWLAGRGDFINGVRLVYPMQDQAMRFFNLLGQVFQPGV